jgi:hypothetical protein
MEARYVQIGISAIFLCVLANQSCSSERCAESQTAVSSSDSSSKSICLCRSCALRIVAQSLCVDRLGVESHGR